MLGPASTLSRSGSSPASALWACSLTCSLRSEGLQALDLYDREPPERSDLPAATQAELLLIQGKSEEATGATGKAMKTYEPLLKNFDTAYGAEGYIRHSTLLFRAGKVKETKKQLDASSLRVRHSSTGWHVPSCSSPTATTSRVRPMSPSSISRAA